MKNSFQEDFKKNSEILYKMNKETLIIEVKKSFNKRKICYLRFAKRKNRKVFERTKIGEIT